jgi:WD40 repeat protein
MQQQPTDCDDGRLRQLLLDELPDQLTTEVVEHVAHCPRCRERLETLAGEPAWWSEVQSSLQAHAAKLKSSDASVAPALPPAAADDAFVADFAVDFLVPCSREGTLGSLGDYEIVEIIGRGGMGIVLKGFERELGRYVAVKVMAPHLAASGAARQRFSREAMAAAVIVHPNVMPILTVNATAKLPYLVMPYMACESLQQRIDRDGALGTLEVLRIGVQVARGLAAAHAHGLVHRDIKPHNILLEKSIDRVLLTDFGLARAVDDASLTRTGVIAGTPQFMSPEQARGDALTCQTDLFSLGSVLYAMAAGRPPFRAETSYAVLRRIIESEPRPIRETSPEIPAWLEQIVSRLHAKLPTERFPSADEVAQLLQQCLVHVQQPTVAPLPPELTLEASLPKRAAANKGRSRAIVPWLAACFLGLGAAATGIGAWWMQPGPSNVERAPSHDVPVTLIRDRLAEGLARRLPSQGDTFGVIDRPAPLNEAPGPMMGLALSPDGQWIATGSGHGSGPGEIVVWDRQAGTRRWSHRHLLGVRGVGFSRDGERIAIATFDGVTRILETATGKVLHEWEKQPSGVYAVAFTPDGRVVTGGDDGVLRVYRIGKRHPERLLRGHEQMVISLDVSPDGSRLVSGSRDRTVRIWNLNSSQSEHILEGHTDLVNSVRFSRDGRQVASASFDGSVSIWSVETGEELERLDARRGRAVSVAFAPGGKQLVSGYYDGSIVSWDLETRKEVGVTERAHAMPVFGLVFSVDGETLVSSGFDGAAKVWDERRKLQQTLERRVTPIAPPLAAAWSDDERLIATVHAGGLVRATDVDTGQVVQQLERGDDPPHCVAFLAGGKFALGCESGAVVLWDVSQRPAAIEVLGKHVGTVRALAVTADRDRLASCSDDGVIRFWDWESQKEAAQWNASSDPPTTLAFAPAGRMLASGHADGEVRFWDISKEPRLAHSVSQPGAIMSLAFSSDGTTLAAADRSGVSLWDIMTLRSNIESEPRVRLGELESAPTCLAFSPRSIGLAVGLEGGELLVFNPEMGRRTARYLRHGAALTAMAIGPASETVLTLGADGPLLWRRAEPEYRPLTSLRVGNAGVRQLDVDWKRGTVITAEYDNRVYIRSLATGEMLVVLGEQDRISVRELSPDQNLLTVSFVSGRLEVYDMRQEPLKPLRALSGLTERAETLAISPDGARLVALSRSEGIRLYDLTSGDTAPVFSAPAKELPPTHVAFSPDSQFFLTCTGDYRRLHLTGEAVLRRSDTGAAVRSFRGHSSQVRHAAFHPSGELVVIGGADRVARVYDVASGQIRARLEHSSAIIYSLFVPESNLLLTATYNGTVWVWNVPMQENIARIPVHADFISGMKLSPDRSVLVTASRDGFVKFWPLTGEGNDLSFCGGLAPER